MVMVVVVRIEVSGRCEELFFTSRLVTVMLCQVLLRWVDFAKTGYLP